MCVCVCVCDYVCVFVFTCNIVNYPLQRLATPKLSKHLALANKRQDHSGSISHCAEPSDANTDMLCMYMYVCNLSTVHVGTTGSRKCILISLISQKYTIGTSGTVLIREVSLFQRKLREVPLYVQLPYLRVSTSL